MLNVYSFISGSGNDIPTKFYIADTFLELPVGQVGDLFFAVDTGRFYSSTGISLATIFNNLTFPMYSQTFLSNLGFPSYSQTLLVSQTLLDGYFSQLTGPI